MSASHLLETLSFDILYGMVQYQSTYYAMQASSSLNPWKEEAQKKGNTHAPVHSTKFSSGEFLSSPPSCIDQMSPCQLSGEEKFWGLEECAFHHFPLFSLLALFSAVTGAGGIGSAEGSAGLPSSQMSSTGLWFSWCFSTPSPSPQNITINHTGSLKSKVRGSLKLP